jgi:hypothetical protein
VIGEQDDTGCGIGKGILRGTRIDADSSSARRRDRPTRSGHAPVEPNCAGGHCVAAKGTVPSDPKEYLRDHAMSRGESCRDEADSKIGEEVADDAMLGSDAAGPRDDDCVAQHLRRVGEVLDALGRARLEAMKLERGQAELACLLPR